MELLVIKLREYKLQTLKEVNIHLEHTLDDCVLNLLPLDVKAGLLMLDNAYHLSQLSG
jgi:hypothetical protein